MGFTFKSLKSQVSIYLIFMIAAIFIILITAVFIPFGVLFNTRIYAASEKMILDANDTTQSIENETVRSSMQTIFAGSLGNINNNIEVNNALFRYGWIIALIIIGITLFMFTRALIEVNKGGVA